MGRREYSEEFRRDAVKQVVENGYGIIETAERLGVPYSFLFNLSKIPKNSTYFPILT